ncbi:hypothetical protein DL93DRAFT_1249845 [Clavulina sp. PMI_390]|nr:hypothetical protein DL93DRAFT_1249845 [Clavulina sp. PMI_390]
MHHHGSSFNPLLARDCVSCPATAPKCACSSGYSCVLTSQYVARIFTPAFGLIDADSGSHPIRSCTACAQAQCIPISSGSSSGVSSGALAGAVVGVLAFLFLVVGGFLWWRRRNARRANRVPSEKSSIPSSATAAAAAVAAGSASASSPVNPRFSRPLEKTPGMENENPFETGSVRSGAPSAQSIPIGFASDGQPSPPAVSPTTPGFPGVPVRPARAPDLNIRATPFNNNSGLAPPRPNYAPSQRTDFTTSTMDSTASSAMEALYESPTIVTGVKRTVIGAGRGAVVPVASVGSSPSSTPRGNGSMRRTLTPGPSPLASAGFTRSELGPMPEEDPFGDNLSLRSQSTAMTNMSFGMGTPTASIRSFAQPTVASRVNVASLARSATLRSIGTPSIAPSASNRDTLDHPLSTAELSHRPESVQSFASNTDSVLASFPFVPPSPLPSSNGRSPLSVVFTPGISNRQSNASSMFGSDAGTMEVPPPLPTTYDVSALNSSHLSSTAATAGSVSAPFTPTPPTSTTVAPVTPSTAAATAGSSKAPRVSTMSSAGGLDDFEFEFGPEEPMPTISLAAVRSDSVSGALSAVDHTELATSRANSMLVDNNSTHGNAHGNGSNNTNKPEDRNASRASLDLFALSRDLEAHKLAYD